MSDIEAKERVCRVLLIEDDPDDVFLFKRALERAHAALGCDIACEHVGNGLEALFFVSRHDLMDKLPDVLVLDLNMPRLDGISFLRSLRKSLLLKELPVYVLTTSNENAVHAEAMRAGADKAFVKPNDADALLGIVREIVERGCIAQGQQ